MEILLGITLAILISGILFLAGCIAISIVASILGGSLKGDNVSLKTLVALGLTVFLFGSD
jgi:hypothetical protein